MQSTVVFLCSIAGSLLNLLSFPYPVVYFIDPLVKYLLHLSVAKLRSGFWKQATTRRVSAAKDLL